MIDHERARELAALSGASEIDPVDRDWLRDHLTACEACRAAIGGSGIAAPAEPPPGLRRRGLDRASISKQVRRPAFLVTVGVIAVALVAGGLAWNGGQRRGGDVADASQPSRNPTAAGSMVPEPSADIDPGASFEPLLGEAAAPKALLTASGARGAVVPLDAGFRLASVDATPASRLAARLTIDPSIAFSVKPEAGDRAALITPSTPLQPGTVYRFALNGPAGELLDTWAFQARQPLRVVGSLPGNEANDVPIDTGIEVIFDQDGVTDAASHISVNPAIGGRFEQHGRTTVFVPEKRLAPATIYTVTVSRGVMVGSTGEATLTDSHFQFETAATTDPGNQLTFEFPDQVLESATADRPIVGFWTFGVDQVEGQAKVLPKTTHVDGFRLAGLDAGIAAFRTLRAGPAWARWATRAVVDTTKLQRVVSVDALLNQAGGAVWLQLPDRLAAGWYVVQQTVASRSIQAVLQVTDVAGYVATSETRTIVWVNDLKTGRPIVGATAASEGSVIGRTDAQGLATGPTPASLGPDPSRPCDASCEPVVKVGTTDGRSIFLPTTLSQDKLDPSGNPYFGSPDPQYWTLLHSDRGRYRPTDTVNIWGVVRNRDSGKVPATVTVRLIAQAYDDGNVRPPVASLASKPGPTGSFTGSLPLRGLAEGQYTIELVVGGRAIRSAQILVAPIVKPAYRLEVQTGRRVYIAGDRIKVTVGATFFEGTPVPGVPLRINGFVEHDVTTDATGNATYLTTAKTEPDAEGVGYQSVGVNPARAEEGEIAAASREFVVFPSSRTIDATARIAGGRVRVTGSVHLVAVDRLEKQITNGRYIWDLDPRGGPVRGATVTARFVELVPVRTKTGTAYDFIEKKVVDTYNVDLVEHAAGSIRVRTAANGTWSASIPATDHDYQVILTVSDPDGHVAKLTTSASADVYSTNETRNATLRPTGSAGADAGSYGVGDRVDLTLTDPDTKQTAGDGTRYLFFLAQRGIRSGSVQSSPRFVSTFAPWAPPNLDIGAVRFTGDRYVGTLYFNAQYRAADRRLQVDLTIATPRYVPGALATVNVRTRTATGTPTAASVILRAVDEKLYAIGAAAQDDPLMDLYGAVESGMFGTYASHRTPRQQFEGGDTTGGGGDDRNDFRDSLLFRSITTDKNGRGSVSFRLSDDLTSWRVSASAITSRLDAGAGSVLVPVGLPFFVDASIAPEYLVGDRPSIPVRTFGSAIRAGDAVTFEVTSTSLGFDSGPIHGAAFATTTVPLPRLPLGTQTVTISATTGSGTAARTDRLTRTFTVVATHLSVARTSYAELPLTGALAGGAGLTTVVVSDASAGRYLSLLTDLADGGGARLDRALAADIASSLLASRFGSAVAAPDGGTFNAARYQAANGGLALLPYASVDVELSALVAIIAPDLVDRARLGSYLRGIHADSSETRERQVFSLAGLGGLGDSVLPAVQAAAADPALTIREQLMLGLGAAALGDSGTARAIVTSLIAAHGERAGPRARLRVGSSNAEIATATALIAILTAALGDDRAPLFWAYVEANPVADQLSVLPAVGYVSNILGHLPVQPARFAYTVDGARRVVELDAGRSFELSLTASQLATLTFERIAGSIGVTTGWRESIQAAALQLDPDVTISRAVAPAGTIASADLVKVELTVTFGPQAASGCRQVTELVPSGLTPVGLLATWVDPDNTDVVPDPGVVMPYDQSGARVFFCAEPTPTQRVLVLRYFARVVSPGTYAWEPAIAESLSQTGHAALTSPTEIIIR